MAQVKFDKEALIKHHFWILSGVFVLLALIPMCLLGMGVSDSVTKAQKSLDDTKKSVAGVKSPKNQSWVDAKKRADDIVKKRRDVVWDQAWKTQEMMMTWPEQLLPRWSKYKYMGEPIEQFEEKEWVEDYSEQLGDIPRIIQPVNDYNGDGSVQFKGGSLEGLFQLQRKFDNRPVTTEDIWLAQEDFWVKRELALIIREANDAVARFKEVTPQPAQEKTAAKPAPAADKTAKDGQPPAVVARSPDPVVARSPDRATDGHGQETVPQQGGTAKDAQPAAAKEAKPAPAKPAAPPSDPNHKIFRNPYWELDLTLARSNRGKYSVRGTIQNIGKKKEPLGIDFMVFLDDIGSAGVLLPANMLPLAVGQKETLPEVQVSDAATVKGLYGVEQVLTWRTAPVKRVDELALNHNSSRTAHKALIKPRWIKDEAPPTEGQPSGGQDPTGLAPGGDTQQKMRGSGMNMQKMMLGGNMAGGGQAGLSKNGLVLNRYTDANDQVRHMPVGMVVIVEEDHIPEFLAAVANSKLRIETQQMHWHHIREKIKPDVKESSGPPAVGKTQPTPTAGGPTGNKFAPGQTMPQGMYGGNMMDRMRQNMMAGSNSVTMPMGGPAGIRRQLGGGPLQGGKSPFLGTTTGTNVATMVAQEEEEAEMNLVELAVYGVASLYERYPAKPPAVAVADAGNPSGGANK
jgi:hypothetical protein